MSVVVEAVVIARAEQDNAMNMSRINESGCGGKALHLIYDIELLLGKFLFISMRVLRNIGIDSNFNFQSLNIPAPIQAFTIHTYKHTLVYMNTSLTKAMEFFVFINVKKYRVCPTVPRFYN